VGEIPVKVFAAVMLVSLTFGAGLQVDRDNLKASLKRVGLLGRALLANFVIVPILGVAIVKLFRLPIPIGTGILLMAIAPGVPLVLSQVRKRGGRLSLAVELAVVLPLLSIVTVPVTAAFVLPAPIKAELPLGHFAVTLVLFQLLPLILGIVVGGLLPGAARLARPLNLVFFAAAIALLALLSRAILDGIESVYGSRGIYAMLAITLLSMAAGWLLGGPAREDRRILGIGTTLRNVGLASLIATTSLRSSQIAASVLIYLLIQFILTTAFGIYFARTAKEATA
jgi:BASS family bile acid:Na+ symporter